MKRALSAILAAMLLVALLPAIGVAANDSIKIEMPQEIWITDYAPFPPALTITNQSPHDVTLTIQVYDEQIRGKVAASSIPSCRARRPARTPRYTRRAQRRRDQHLPLHHHQPGRIKKILYFAQVMDIDRTNDIRYAQWENTAFPRTPPAPSAPSSACSIPSSPRTGTW